MEVPYSVLERVRKATMAGSSGDANGQLPVTADTRAHKDAWVEAFKLDEVREESAHYSERSPC